MFRLARPTPARLDAFLAAQRTATFAYPEVGASRGATPPGYNVDHHRVRLGHGAPTFRRAREALRAWRMFALDWVRIHPAAAPVVPGSTVAVVVRHYGFWSANANRLVYAIDEDDGAEARFGFAYGTLPAHAEIGEERFLVTWDRRDDAVWYDLFAFSRPRHPLARLGYPLSRALQRRFARESLQAMAAAVAAGGRDA